MFKYFQAISIILVGLFFCVSTEAADTQTKSLTLSVYNHGQALINEVRTLKMQKGESYLEFLDVPQTINPATLQIKSLTASKSFSVLDINYEYDLINVHNLLNKYIGKEVKIVIPDNEDTDKTIVTPAVLLSNNDRPVFEVDGKIYIGNYNSLYLAQMPKGLRASPALVWLVDNKGPKQQDISVSYLANGITWQSDYVLKIDKDNQKASLAGWVTIDNQSGKSFNDVSLKLVAGDLNTVKPEISDAYMAQGARVAKFALDDGMKEEDFFEYHLYSLERNVNVSNNQTKQVRLLSADEIEIEKDIISYFRGYPSRNYNEIKQKSEVYISFKNNKSNDLGVPLPKGIIRAYKESSDGSVLFVGEDKIEHTPKDETVKLKMGEAFDIRVKRILKAYEKKDKSTLKYTWSIIIRNSKNMPQKIILKDYIQGQWDIVNSTHKYQKIDANHITFTLDVLPYDKNDDLVVEYTAICEI